MIIYLNKLFTGLPMPPRHIVEGIVSALRTKAESNANAIRVLDTLAKLASAVKNVNTTQDIQINLQEFLNDDD